LTLAGGGHSDREKTMLKNKQPAATVAVRNLADARAFYEGKLGLDAPVDEMSEAMRYVCDGVSLLVYRSTENAGTSKATSVTWAVGDDIAETVKALKANGVAFENYDMPDGEKEGDIYHFGEIRTAWFEDPDGNIHALVNG
jgi:catechol 2,3-dioxygenase-like lactoylglutathione lyase family enzyme